MGARELCKAGGLLIVDGCTEVHACICDCITAGPLVLIAVLLVLQV